MPYTVDDPGTWLQMRDAGVDGIITNRAGTLVGWNARYKQGTPSPKIKAPADGAKLTRGDVVTLAFEGAGAATLDGKPIAEGDPIRADDLALGRHVVALDGTSAGLRWSRPRAASRTSSPSGAGSRTRCACAGSS